jgi:hypothetical protein
MPVQRADSSKWKGVMGRMATKKAPAKKAPAKKAAKTTKKK